MPGDLGLMSFGQAISAGLAIMNFVALIAAALLAFLLTSWRTRLTWLDWTIAMLPFGFVVFTLLSSLSYLQADWLLIPGGYGVALGLPLGLLCSSWVIAAGSRKGSPRIRGTN